MSLETTIPLNDISDEDDIRDLVQRLSKVTGQSLNIERQLVITTDDVNLSSMLDSFADAVREGSIGKNTSVKKAKGEKKADGQSSVIGGSSRRIVGTGEILSLVELKKRIQAGEVGDGTVVENKHGERFVVMSGELIKEPQS